MSLIPRVDDGDVTPRHRGGYDVNPTPKGDDERPPDPCTTPFDAITVIRTEVFLFIGKVRGSSWGNSRVVSLQAGY